MKKTLIVLLSIFLCACSKQIEEETYVPNLKDIEISLINNQVHQNSIADEIQLDYNNKGFTITQEAYPIKFNASFNYTDLFTYTLEWEPVNHYNNEKLVATLLSSYFYDNEPYTSYIRATLEFSDGKEDEIYFDKNRIKIYSSTTKDEVSYEDDFVEFLYSQFLSQIQDINQLHYYFGECNSKLSSIIKDKLVYPKENYFFGNKKMDEFIFSPQEYNKLPRSLSINMDDHKEINKLPALYKSLSLASLFTYDVNRIEDIDETTLLTWLTMIEPYDYSCTAIACSKNGNPYPLTTNGRSEYATTFYYDANHLNEIQSQIINSSNSIEIDETILLQNGLVLSKEDNAIVTSFNDTMSHYLIVNEISENRYEVIPYQTFSQLFSSNYTSLIHIRNVDQIFSYSPYVAEENNQNFDDYVLSILPSMKKFIIVVEQAQDIYKILSIETIQPTVTANNQ